ncbi:efflux RND transporter periplasmic adaptor subunit [Flavihumibacter profundi]|jgi:membrane fusion protein, multidrug efflux system|uniref:efflux RND transporter periplasmic adaptor subunit n=1 Tax=Flavihumibacter profundi TaxID=2716883 RepID=UPI001CC543BD|nr:efflux RND transporter periplasmic adaptor subunit [Flavihumibacter profundi]MBZ5856620.1 efflux RND transporter periplasmic adaptor subunit [Flavihumibacter profundi]
MCLYKRFYFPGAGYSLLVFWAILSHGCGSGQAPKPESSKESIVLPVLKITQDSATTYKDYTAALEGKINIDIRAQVDGYLNGILIDEGAYVKAGQSLFRIDDKVYREELNTAIANLHVAEAHMNAAQIEIDKLTPLVENKVISDIQLKSAQAAYNAALASVEQGKAAVSSARINLGFTLIKAPVNGFIGRIPKRLGGLVSRNDPQGLTTLSDIDSIYAYFTLSESGFLSLNQQREGLSTQDMINKLRPVTLILANGTAYSHKGKINLVNGQFDKTTGSITLRATFPNPEKLLRSGNTGKVRMEEHMDSVLLVPISATMDQQDKIFVYLLGDSNLVKRQSISVMDKAGTSYIVKEGIKPGDKIVTEGMERLTEGTRITPKPGQ